MQSLNMHYANATEKWMTTITFFEMFYEAWCVWYFMLSLEVPSPIGFAIFYQRYSTSFSYPKTYRLTNAYHSFRFKATTSNSTMHFFLKELSYYLLHFACCYDLSNITCWYLKLLCDIYFQKHMFTVCHIHVFHNS